MALPRLLPRLLWLGRLVWRGLLLLLLPLLLPQLLPLLLKRLPLRLLLLLPRLPLRLLLLPLLLGRRGGRCGSCSRRRSVAAAKVAPQGGAFQLPASTSSRCLGWRLRRLAAAHGALCGRPLRLLPGRGASGANHLLALLLQQGEKGAVVSCSGGGGGGGGGGLDMHAVCRSPAARTMPR